MVNGLNGSLVQHEVGNHICNHRRANNRCDPGPGLEPDPETGRMKEKKPRLIHYGASHYDPEKFLPISDIPFRNKPGGGLWTTPVDSKYGWKEWTDDESYGCTDEHFEVEFKGTILRINSCRDMNKLPWIEQREMHFITFQAMCIPGFYYDAIHLTEKGQRETRLTYPKSLYGWDCETVFVMNPASIQGQ